MSVRIAEFEFFEEASQFQCLIRRDVTPGRNLIGRFASVRLPRAYEPRILHSMVTLQTPKSVRRTDISMATNKRGVICSGGGAPLKRPKCYRQIAGSSNWRRISFAEADWVSLLLLGAVRCAELFPGKGPG